LRGAARQQATSYTAVRAFAAPAREKFDFQMGAGEKKVDPIAKAYAETFKKLGTYYKNIREIEVPLDLDPAKVAAYADKLIEEKKKVGLKVGYNFSERFLPAGRKYETAREVCDVAFAGYRASFDGHDPQSGVYEALDQMEKKLGRPLLTSDDKALWDEFIALQKELNKKYPRLAHQYASFKLKESVDAATAEFEKHVKEEPDIYGKMKFDVTALDPREFLHKKGVPIQQLFKKMLDLNPQFKPAGGRY